MPEAAPKKRPLDRGAVAALTWAVVAIGLTLVIGPELGLRGWLWLGLHHLLCLVGVSHELWRAQKRARQATVTAPPRPRPGSPARP